MIYCPDEDLDDSLNFCLLDPMAMLRGRFKTDGDGAIFPASREGPDHWTSTRMPMDLKRDRELQQI